MSVCLSVTELHWRIIANLGFKFRSKFTVHCRRGRDHLKNNIYGTFTPSVLGLDTSVA